MLNKYHPFREKVAFDAQSASAAASESAVRPAMPDNSRDKADFLGRLKRRLKIIAWCFALVFGIYLYIKVYALFHSGGSAAVPASSSQAVALIGEGDEDEGETYRPRMRHVEDARRSVSVFHRIFCSGGRKAAYCD